VKNIEAYLELKQLKQFSLLNISRLAQKPDSAIGKNKIL